MDDVTRLALQARDGDREALAALLGRLQGDIWRYCSAMLGADQADDAAQDAMLRILRSIGRYEGSAPARIWAIAIARHTCLDVLRRRYRRRALLDTVIAEARRSSVVAQPEHDWADLVRLLEHLDAERREAFVLTQILGWSYAEAATAASCPVGTIRSRVARARADLLELWEESGNRNAAADDR